MGLFQEIEVAAQKRKIDFLVIGGVAIIFYGYSRDTADLDLLIRRADHDLWLELLSEMGFTVFREQDTFVQLNPPKEGAWPLDLMLVADATFEPMFAASLNVEIYGANMRIPALEHFIALKLHALKHSHTGRYLKDLLDVENLVRLHSINLHEEKWRQIFLKYGTVELYGQLSRLTAGEEH